MTEARWESPTETPFSTTEDWPGLLPNLNRGAGRYRDLGLVRRHRFVEVRRVRDQVLGRQLALKRVWPASAPRSACAMLIAEGQLGAQLQHPGIVPVYDLAEDDPGHPYFVMPLIEGQHLGLWMERLESADPDRAPAIAQAIVTWLATACAALTYAHGRGVAHGDLKPEHVRITVDGQVRVLDWGVARTWPVPLDAVSTIVEGGPGALAAESGTAPYRDPHQGPMARPEAADVYAVGVMLHQVNRYLEHEAVRDQLDDTLAAPPAGRVPMSALAQRLADLRL